MSYSTQHQGELLKKRIDQYLATHKDSLSNIADKLNISRPTLYDKFESSKVALETFVRVGEIIGHDFSDEVDELKKLGRINETTVKYERQQCEEELTKCHNDNMKLRQQIIELNKEVVSLREQLQAQKQPKSDTRSKKNR